MKEAAVAAASFICNDTGSLYADGFGDLDVDWGEPVVAVGADAVDDAEELVVQRLGDGQEVDVAVVDDGAQMEAAVAGHRPELIVCPMLKAIIPESIWRNHRCLVVHPGPHGDRELAARELRGPLDLLRARAERLAVVGETLGADSCRRTGITLAGR